MVRLIKQKLANGAAPGPSGWTGELVQALTGDPECVRCICILVEDIINGNLRPDARSYLLASTLHPIPKGDGGIRPIAVGEVWYKLAASYVMDSVRDSFPALFEPIQMGVGCPGGAEKAANVLRAGLEIYGNESILLKCDIRNAFNERKRDQILQELFRHDELRPMWKLAHWSYSTPSPLLVMDHGNYCTTIRSEQGVRQGDCFGSFLYALSVQPHYVGCSQGLGQQFQQIAIADDLNMVGTIKNVFTAFDRFRESIRDTGLVINTNKCGILWQHPTPVPEALKEAAAQRGIQIYTTVMKVLGVYLGSSVPDLKQQLEGCVNQHKALCEILKRPELPAQIAILILRLCVLPSMQFTARTVPPPISEAHLQEFDLLIRSTICERLSLPNPLPEEALQSLTLPIRLGGCGFRQQSTISSVAFYSAMALAASTICQLIPPSERPRLLHAGPDQLQFAQQVSNCRDDIAHVLPNAPAEFLPPTSQEFWRLYGEFRAPRGIQKALTGFLDETALAMIKANPDVTKQTLQRLASAGSKNAGAWLNALPHSLDLILLDPEFIYAVRHHIGLPPHDDLPAICACGASLLADPSHFHSCQLLKRGPITVRHDRLVKTVSHGLRAAGGYAQVEFRPSDQERTRPDITVVFPAETIMIDVVVSHPSAPSRISVEPLACTHRAEKAKVAKYQQLANSQGARVLAFAVESYGGFGEHATSIIQLIRRSLAQSAELQDKALHNLLPQHLAITLQKGNAIVARVGSQRARQAASQRP